MTMTSHYTGLINRYRDRLPIGPNTPVITLNEGNTPLIELTNLPKVIGKDVRIFCKFEGLNPTGSFKDRGMTMAVTKAVEAGARAIICASTGNTSAAAAAYAARAGITCYVLIPEGKIALGKLSQAMMHGSVVIQIRGNFDDGMRLVQEVAQTIPVNIVNSINPYRLQGQKTIAFEVIEALGDAPDYHALPVGNAGNISAHWMGYSEAVGKNTATCSHCDGDCKYLAKPIATRRPIMLGYQATGAAPFSARCDGGRARDHCHRNPHRPPGIVETRVGGKKRIRWLVQRMHRRRDPAGTETPRRKRRNFLRTGLGGFNSGSAQRP